MEENSVYLKYNKKGEIKVSNFQEAFLGPHQDSDLLPVGLTLFACVLFVFTHMLLPNLYVHVINLWINI